MPQTLDAPPTLPHPRAVTRGSPDEASRTQELAQVRAARGGEREAFAALHRRYAPWVQAILLARVPADAVEDLGQEVFLRAWKRLPSLKDPGAFGSWLGRIARNRAVDFFRRRRLTEALPEDVARSAPPTAEAAEALAAIRALPETYREVLLLRLVEGWSGPEIAAHTGLTPGSTRVKLHRGMQLLRERLGARER